MQDYRLRRYHFIKITPDHWEDKVLRMKIKTQARGHAGRHPGLTVVVKKGVRFGKRVIYETVWRFTNNSGVPRDWT